MARTFRKTVVLAVAVALLSGGCLTNTQTNTLERLEYQKGMSHIRRQAPRHLDPADYAADSPTTRPARESPAPLPSERGVLTRWGRPHS